MNDPFQKWGVYQSFCDHLGVLGKRKSKKCCFSFLIHFTFYVWSIDLWNFVLACPRCCFTSVVRPTDPASATSRTSNFTLVSGWQAWFPPLCFSFSLLILLFFSLLCLLWNVSLLLREQFLSRVYELAERFRVVFLHFLVRQAEWLISGPPRTSLKPVSKASQVKKSACTH